MHNPRYPLADAVKSADVDLEEDTEVAKSKPSIESGQLSKNHLRGGARNG